MPAQPIQALNAYLDDGGDEIVVIEKVDGGVRERRQRAEYVTWHRAADIAPDDMRRLKSFPSVRSIRVADDWARIAWSDDWTRKSGRKGMRENGVDSFEGDVDPVMLWLVESGAKIAKPRRCYLDLETDSRVPLSRKEDMRILSWSVVSDETGEAKVAVLEENTDDAERSLLGELSRHLDGFDQVVTWEGDWKGGEFDTVVLPARMRRRNVTFDMRRYTWVNQLAVWRRMNMHSAASGAEKESMKLEDIAFEQLREGKEKAPAWVVERFGSRGLGSMTWDLWESGEEGRALLKKYNVRDTVLQQRLEKKKGYLTLFQALCEACGLVPETRSLQPTRQMDGFLLRLGRGKNHRFATKAFREDDEEDQGQFKGATVFFPKSVPVPDNGWSKEDAANWRKQHGLKNGILRDVHVCDFASLYPSVMMSWNLSAESIVGWKNAAELKDGLAPDTCRSPGTGLITRTDVIGYLPLAFHELIRLRKKYSDLAASLPPGSPEWQDAMSQSTAYKVAANSFYGGGASKYSRFNNRDASEACTQNGVHLLKLTAAHAEKRSMVTVYGDTDSVFVMRPSEVGFRNFIKWLNEKEFPREIASHGCRENYVKLAFEKTFERIVFVSKKAYVGRYSQYKGTPAKRDERGRLVGEPEIKGVAYKRGDKGKLARELQAKVIDLLVGGVTLRNEAGKEVPANPGVETPTEDLAAYHAVITKSRDHLLNDPLAIEEVRLSKNISKSLREYSKDESGAHVRLARELEAAGEVVGKGYRIEYVVVDGDVTPQRVILGDNYAGECDRFYLWERVYEPSRALLEAAFPDEDWDVWAKVRPEKPRARGKKVAEGQLGLQMVAPKKSSTRVDDLDELAIPAYSAKPLVVRIHEEGGSEAIDRVNEALRAHPGPRAVEVVIVLRSGEEALLSTPLRVSTGPRLREAVDRALAPTVAS